MNKIKILNESDINKILNMNIAIEAVENAYKQKSNLKGNVWPLVFYEYEHNIFDLDIRSGNLVDSNAYGLKLISYNENNTQLGLNKVNATSLICDDKTGRLIAMLNAAPITSYRTGAAAGIGAKYLARKNSEILLVVGSGNIAVYSIVATLITVSSIKKILICNPKDYNSLFSKIDKLKNQIEELLSECNLSLQAEIECTSDLEKSVKMSDIIITATPSEKAMIDCSWVKQGTHFSCMGACMENKQEIDEMIFSKARVYADDINQCIKSGESQTAFKKGIISNFNGEIGDVMLNKEKGRVADEDITIFDSTGLFIQDLATSIEILNNSENIGIEVDL